MNINSRLFPERPEPVRDKLADRALWAVGSGVVGLLVSTELSEGMTGDLRRGVIALGAVGAGLIGAGVHALREIYHDSLSNDSSRQARAFEPPRFI